MKTAILVIDVQAGLFDEAGKPFDYQNVICNINKLTDVARKKQSPVIFVQHETNDEFLRYKSNSWQLVSDLEVDENDYVVRKTTPNSFHRTNLSEILEKEGITTIIVCGYATEFCVDSTIRAAAALGYQVLIVADGHTTHHKKHASAELIREHHNETLSNIRSFGVEIQAVETLEIVNRF